MSSIAFAALLSLSMVTEEYLGVHVINEAVPLDEPGRYESPRTYDDTLQYYKWHFKSRGGVRWRNVVNLPHIRAKHIQSVRPRTKWQGINIYERNGRVRLFIVPRVPVSKPPKS